MTVSTASPTREEPPPFVTATVCGAGSGPPATAVKVTVVAESAMQDGGQLAGGADDDVRAVGRDGERGDRVRADGGVGGAGDRDDDGGGEERAGPHQLFNAPSLIQERRIVFWVVVSAPIVLPHPAVPVTLR